METINKIKKFFEKNKWIIFFIFIFPCAYTERPDYIGPAYNFIYNVLVYPIGIFILIDYFFIKKIKPSPLMLSLLGLLVWMVIEQLRIDWFTYLDYCIIFRIIILSMIIEIYHKTDRKNLLIAFMLLFECLLYPNLVTIMINRFNNRPKDYTFLGYYNNIIVFTLPALCVSALYYENTKKKIRPIMLGLVAILCTILSSAATPLGSLIGVAGLFVFEIILIKVFKLKNIKLWPWIVIALLFNVFVVFIYREGVIPIMDSFIVNVLHRKTNFTGRTAIWDEAMKLLLNAKKFGYGYDPGVEVGPNHAAHAHNELMSLWIKYGIVGEFLYAIFSIIYIIKIDKQELSIYKVLFVSLIFGIFLAFITDWVYRSYLYYIIFFFAYHFKKSKSV